MNDNDTNQNEGQGQGQWQAGDKVKVLTHCNGRAGATVRGYRGKLVEVTMRDGTVLAFHASRVHPDWKRAFDNR